MYTLIEKYNDVNKFYRYESRKGVEQLCKLAGDLGYKDSYHYGQMTRDACIGNLIAFLEDNSGAIEAIINWVAEQNSPEMRSALIASSNGALDDEDEDECD